MGVTTLADKTTLDKIDTDITTLKSRGGFKASSDGFYGYDITNDVWQKVNFGELSGANPTLVVINDSMTMTGEPVTVSNNFYSKTQVMRGSYDIFALPSLGTYNVTWNNGTTSVTEQVNVNALGGVSVSVIAYPSFANATWEQISALALKAYRANSDFSLSDIWNVGDTKSIDIDATSATYVSETQPSCTRTIKIMGFEHDNLTTAINGHTKAQISLGITEKLPNAGIMSSNPNSNAGGWAGELCVRRTWCNNTFYNALPNGLKSLIKNVDKLSGSGAGQGDTLTTSSDKCWLLSSIEAGYGNQYFAASGEGSAYSNPITLSNNTWFRTSTTKGGYNAHYYIKVGNDTSQYGGGESYGIQPGFSI